MADQPGKLLLDFASIVILAADHRDTHENNLFCLTILTWVVWIFARLDGVMPKQLSWSAEMTASKAFNTSLEVI
jgi:hypothetical protein